MDAVPRQAQRAEVDVVRHDEPGRAVTLAAQEVPAAGGRSRPAELAFHARAADGAQRRSQHDDADHSAGGQPGPGRDRPVLELLAARAASPGPAAAALSAMNGMKIVTNTAPILAARGYGASLPRYQRRAVHFPRHRSNGFSLCVNWVSQ